MAGDDREYIPGVCNIGRGEVKKRRVLGWIGLVATVLLWATLVALKTAPLWRLLLFVPALLCRARFHSIDLAVLREIWVRGCIQIRAERRQIR